MPYTAKAVANTFIDLANAEGCTLTNAKIQHLVFLAHGFHLGIHGENYPLVREHFVAADEGPIVPTLNMALRHRVSTPGGKLQDEKGKDIPSLPEDTDEYDTVFNAWHSFKNYLLCELDGIARDHNTAWKHARSMSKNTELTTEIIASFFRILWNKMSESVAEKEMQTA
jgi:uncharacterized phage-associated protein